MEIVTRKKPGNRTIAANQQASQDNREKRFFWRDRSPSVGASGEQGGGEGLYGRPPLGTELFPGAGDHKGPPFPAPAPLAPTDNGGFFNNPIIVRTLAVVLTMITVLFSLSACDGPTISFGGAASPTPSGLPGNAQLNTWYPAGRGIDVRYEDWKTADGADNDTITIVRIDPHLVALSVGYQPDKPLLMSQWMQQEHATAIINGGYFDQNDHATALVISNGQAYGSSYSGFGGMLSVDDNTHITLRSLRQQPYDSSESLTQATQCSPMLIESGKRTQFTADPSSSRRSLVAMDKQGKLLFISSPDDVFSLDQMANLLASSDLSINTALNLDGGASTGLYVNGNAQTHVTIDSYVLLPLVVIVKEK